MPGKERKARREGDFYRTPPALTRAFLRLWQPRDLDVPITIVEPAAGDGAMLSPLKERWPTAEIFAYDVAPSPHPDVEQQAFFLMDDAAADLVITNPPFSHAVEFVVKGHEMIPLGGYLVLLLASSFLFSKKRRQFWRDYPLLEWYPIDPRPSFTDDGQGYFADFAFYVWKKGSKPKFIRTRHLNW